MHTSTSQSTHCLVKVNRCVTFSNVLRNFWIFSQIPNEPYRLTWSSIPPPRPSTLFSNLCRSFVCVHVSIVCNCDQSLVCGPARSRTDTIFSLRRHLTSYSTHRPLRTRTQEASVHRGKKNEEKKNRSTPAIRSDLITTNADLSLAYNYKQSRMTQRA